MSVCLRADVSRGAAPLSCRWDAHKLGFVGGFPANHQDQEPTWGFGAEL